MFAGLLTILAAAAMATPVTPPGPDTEDADLRCVAGINVVIGLKAGSSDAGNGALVLALSSNLMYFVGKLEMRYPNFDVGRSLARVYSAPDYAKRADADLQRCSTEVKARSDELIAGGKYLQSLSLRPPGQPG